MAVRHIESEGESRLTVLLALFANFGVGVLKLAAGESLPQAR
jgi:hypothetical protein